VDVETLSDDVAEVQKEVTAPVAAAAEAADPQPFCPQDEASPEFTKDLDMTAHRGESPVQNVPLVETREDLPEGQDPSPSIVAFNKNFGTSYRSELLSVGYEKVAAEDDTPMLLTLWNSSKFVDEIGERASEQAPPPLSTAHDLGKQSSTSLKKTSASSVSAGRITMETLSKKVCELFPLLSSSLSFPCNF
jgi:hypothetical protein